MAAKLYISAQSLLDDAFQLGSRVYNSGFKPTLILALWRGGVPVGLAVQELLAYKNVTCDHIAVRTSSYSNIEERSKQVRIYGINYILKKVSFDDRLLIVDDVYDTGHTISALIQHLKDKAKLNTPEDIRVAVPYYKPDRNQTSRIPDYYIHATDAWIKFPHSLEGLSAEEVAKHRPTLHAIVSQAVSLKNGI